MQHPYACWGDLNKDGYQDLAVTFVTKNTVNSYGWRDWWIVVFHGNSSGAYQPAVVTKEQAGCMSWLLYDRITNSVEFACFESGVGGFHWDGKRYVIRHLMETELPSAALGKKPAQVYPERASFNYPAASYSPTQLPAPYHQIQEATTESLIHS